MNDPVNGSCSKFFRLTQVAITVLIAHTAMAQEQFPFAKDKSLYDHLRVQVLSKDSLFVFAGNKPERLMENSAGYIFPTHFTTGNAGEWRKISHLYHTWLFKLRLPGVTGVAVVFTHLKLAAGAKLFIFNSQVTTGPFEERDMPPSGIMPVAYLPGEELVVELDVPVTTRANDFTISAVSFTDNAAVLSRPSMFGASKRNESCYTCLSGNFWNAIKRSVVKIITFRDGQALMCTGTLVNNTAEDARPFVLTAQHCITSQEDAGMSVFLFNDEDVNCGSDAVLQHSAMNGSVLRATSYENDFSLIELYAHVPLGSRPYFAGWDLTDTGINRVSCIHHPLGGPKKISICNESVEASSFIETGKPARAPNSFWHVIKWDTGITEGGSSGAPLFNGDQKIIGTLTGGASACGYAYHDYFERLSKAWNHTDDVKHQLKYWLDPLASGETKLNGFDPFNSMNISCDTLSNLVPGETTEVMPYMHGSGFLSGCNSDSISTYAEGFAGATGSVTGVQLYLGNLNAESPGGLTVYIMDEKNGLPGDVLAERYVSYASLHLYFNYVEFYPFVNVASHFFVAYTLGCSPGNLFALGLAAWRGGDTNTAYIKIGETWRPMSDISKDGLGTSLYIEPVVCQSLSRVRTATEMILYPNPVSTKLIVSLAGEENEIRQIQVHRLDGRVLLPDYYVYADNVVIDVDTFVSSTYVIEVVTRKKTYVARFIKL